MSNLTEFFWPVLERESEQQKQELTKKLKKEIEKIELANWGSIDPVLEQVRILALAEDDRRKTAETKASIYLAVLAAIAPLSATIIMGFSDLFKGWPLIVLTILFLISITYLARAIIWIFGAIQIGKIHRVDINNLLNLNNNEDIKFELCKEILKCVRKNWDIVNDKLTNVKMAHLFMKRMLISFVLLLIFAGLMSIYPTIHELYTSMMSC